MGKRQTPGVGEAQNPSGWVGHGVGQKTVGDNPGQARSSEILSQKCFKSHDQDERESPLTLQNIEKTERLRGEQSRVH